jgi:hypothetical protein
MKYILHNNHIYHDSCFTCDNCECQLKIFKSFNGNRYCFGCYDDIFGLKCSACSLKIDNNSNFVLFENKYYHQNCIHKCSNCNKTTLANDCSTKFNKNYCFKCYDLLFTPKCLLCGYVSKNLLVTKAK